MIAIIDYGVGNLFSLKSSLKQLGLEAVVTADADTIRKADRLILPGGGRIRGCHGKAGSNGTCAGHQDGSRKEAAAGHLPWHAAAVRKEL